MDIFKKVRKSKTSKDVEEKRGRSILKKTSSFRTDTSLPRSSSLAGRDLVIDDWSNGHTKQLLSLQYDNAVLTQQLKNTIIQDNGHKFSVEISDLKLQLAGMEKEKNKLFHENHNLKVSKSEQDKDLRYFKDLFIKQKRENIKLKNEISQKDQEIHDQSSKAKTMANMIAKMGGKSTKYFNNF